ncbi:hypothetical protein ACLB2K_022331 [Fragaria x ananassa]
MAADLMPQTAIRNWVMIPLSVVMVLIEVLRCFVSKLMRSNQVPNAYGVLIDWLTLTNGPHFRKEFYGHEVQQEVEAGFGVRFEDEGGVRCFVIGCRILDAVFGRIVRLMVAATRIGDQTHVDRI